MASISQGLVLTTAMLVSSTVLYLGFLRQKTLPHPHLPGNSNSQDPTTTNKALRSCLYSEEKKRENKNTKKKRVKFADGAKEESETKKKELREKQRKQSRASSSCRNEIPEIRGMPENRIALYNGILRDRVHRLEYSC